MRTKRKKSVYVLFAAVFCAAYIILSARPLGGEWQLVPQWHLDINTATVENTASEASVPFKLGQNMGYFTADGKMLMLLSFPFKATIADTRYARYSPDAGDTPFYNSDGTKAGVLEHSGFPLFEDERIFLFIPGGGSFAQLDDEGKTMWHYGGTMPITAFDSSPVACVAGFADGSVKEFDRAGHITQEFSPGGSDVSVILGAGVSHDGTMLATVSGQDRQRFVLARSGGGLLPQTSGGGQTNGANGATGGGQTRGSPTRIVFHEYVAGDVHQRLVQFTADDSVVYYDTADALGAVNTHTMRASHIPIDGQAVSLKECKVLRFVLTRSEGTSAYQENVSGGLEGRRPLNTGERVYTVYVIEKFDTVVASFKFLARNAFIRTDGDSLYVGADNAISRMKVEKK